MPRTTSHTRSRTSLPLSITLLALLLGGCQGFNRPASPHGSDARWSAWMIQAEDSDWLTMVERHLQLTPDRAQQVLTQATLNEEDAADQLRLILLNQQTQQRDGWIYARDRGRLLLEQTASPELKVVLEMLLRYNQAMINLQHQQNKNDQLQQQLNQSQMQVGRLSGQVTRLEEQIDALTHLEQRLNTRKEQTEEAVKP